jgi:hypothetical protein
MTKTLGEEKEEERREEVEAGSGAPPFRGSLDTRRSTAVSWRVEAGEPRSAFWS